MSPYLRVSPYLPAPYLSVEPLEHLANSIVQRRDYSEFRAERHSSPTEESNRCDERKADAMPNIPAPTWGSGRGPSCYFSGGMRLTVLSMSTRMMNPSSLASADEGTHCASQ